MQTILRLFAIVLLGVTPPLVVTSVLPGCAQQDAVLRDARMVSNTAVLVIETAQASAELLYTAQQLAAVDKAAAAPGATQESVKAAVDVVRKRWKPVRKLFDEARALHKQLVTALDTGAEAVQIAQQIDALWKKQSEISKQLEQLRGAP